MLAQEIWESAAGRKVDLLESCDVAKFAYQIPALCREHRSERLAMT